MYKPNLPGHVRPLKWVGPDDPAYRASGLIHSAHIPTSATPDKPRPVVVMLHGWAGDESMMWIFKQTLPSGVAAVAPRAPLALADGESFIWFKYVESTLEPEPDSLAAALSQLDRFLASLADLYPVDPERLVLLGFSQGAITANAYILSHPQKAIGLASLAGAMPAEMADRTTANSLTGKPVFIAHGRHDEMLPIDRARQARQRFETLGATVTYDEYDIGHKLTSQGMKDLETWLTDRLSDT